MASSSTSFLPTILDSFKTTADHEDASTHISLSDITTTVQASSSPSTTRTLTSKNDQVFQAYFRGRKMVSSRLELPQGYNGLVYQTSQPLVPTTTSTLSQSTQTVKRLKVNHVPMNRVGTTTGNRTSPRKAAMARARANMKKVVKMTLNSEEEEEEDEENDNQDQNEQRQQEVQRVNEQQQIEAEPVTDDLVEFKDRPKLLATESTLSTTSSMTLVESVNVNSVEFLDKVVDNIDIKPNLDVEARSQVERDEEIVPEERHLVPWSRFKEITVWHADSQGNLSDDLFARSLSEWPLLAAKTVRLAPLPLIIVVVVIGTLRVTLARKLEPLSLRLGSGLDSSSLVPTGHDPTRLNTQGVETSSRMLPTTTRTSQRAPPLLSFPPYIESTRTFNDDNDDMHINNPKPRRHHGKRSLKRTCYNFVMSLPLVFIFACLAFPWWAYWYSMVWSYLIQQRQQYLKALVYTILFVWSDFGALLSVIMCVNRGGGRVGQSNLQQHQRSSKNDEYGGATQTMVSTTRDEEEQVGLLQNDERLSQLTTEQDQTFDRDQDETLDQTLKSNHSRQRPTRSSSSLFKLWLLCAQNGSSLSLAIWLRGIFVAITSIIELVNFDDTTTNSSRINTVAPVAWAFAFFEGLVFGFAVGLFGLYHLFLACRNRTTIESMERASNVTPSRSKINSNHHQQNQSTTQYFKPDFDLTRNERYQLDKASLKYHIYDLGWKQNLISIFGHYENKWIWLIPIGWPPGDGTEFPIDRDKLAKLQKITADIRTGSH
ncbi:palmitoyltransferase for Vac8p [Microbotryomycetes sp. JL221]|nr:palmitoyltransferase for Vac8p [Microbotryomycetes sp. JL221]